MEEYLPVLKEALLKARFAISVDHVSGPPNNPLMFLLEEISE